MSCSLPTPVPVCTQPIFTPLLKVLLFSVLRIKPNLHRLFTTHRYFSFQLQFLLPCTLHASVRLSHKRLPLGSPLPPRPLALCDQFTLTLSHQADFRLRRPPTLYSGTTWCACQVLPGHRGILPSWPSDPNCYLLPTPLRVNKHLRQRPGSSITFYKSSTYCEPHRYLTVTEGN